MYLRPGVYVEELSVDLMPEPDRARDRGTSRVRSRWAAEHGVAAFVGRSPASLHGHRVEIRSASDLRNALAGGPTTVTASVEGFFANGGRGCHLVGVEAYEPENVAEALRLLEHEHDLSVVVLPDLMAALAEERIDLHTAVAIQHAVISHCERTRDRIALLDPPPDLGAQMVHEWRQAVGYDTGFAALYWPWVRTRSAAGDLSVPPSGHVAGVLARLDAQLGPHASPLQERVVGVSGVETATLEDELDVLNPAGVNALTPTGGGELVVSGARTLAQAPPWRRLPARRLMAFVIRSLSSGTRWAVSARAGDRAVWAQLEHDVEGFFRILWHGGALAGTSRSDAYSVRCDEDTNAGRAERGDVITLEGVVRLDATGITGFRVLWVTS